MTPTTVLLGLTLGLGLALLVAWWSARTPPCGPYRAACARLGGRRTAPADEPITPSHA